jgi:hypothetical protein
MNEFEQPAKADWIKVAVVGRFPGVLVVNACPP